MNYNEFVEYIKSRVQELIREEGEVRINNVTKNNGIQYDGLVIFDEKRCVSPSIYLNSFFDDYKSGRSMESIIDDIIHIYIENKNRLEINPKDIISFENVSDKIMFKLINYDKNEALLCEVPHKKFLDLAVVYYVALSITPDDSITYMINNGMFTQWKLSMNELDELARKNSIRTLGFSITRMDTMLLDLLRSQDSSENEAIIDEIESMDADCNKAMYVITNQYKNHGAGCMLYYEKLREFAQELDTDLYILPSSIHEIIVIPKATMFSADELKSMVEEVNANEVSPLEILSDNVYEYNLEKDCVMMAE